MKLHRFPLDRQPDAMDCGSCCLKMIAAFYGREWARQDGCADCKMFRYCLGGGMHLHDDNGQLLYCHYHKL